MRILLDNSSYHLRNLGDIAMLQIAEQRLRELWPNASIKVFTDEPILLNNYCPSVQPLSSRGRAIWFNKPKLFAILQINNHIPSLFYKRLLWLDEMIRHRYPLFALYLVQWGRRFRKIDYMDINEFRISLSKADLVISSGGGFITDAFEEHGIRVLNILEIAIRSGKWTAMFGQGIGPIRSQKLLNKAKSVLPSVNLIALREKRTGLSLLESLGVKPHQVLITGDDAIELAYKARAKGIGTGIGVNLRVATYSEVDNNLLEIIRETLHDAARKYNAQLISLPISLVDIGSDVKTIRQILSGYENVLNDDDNIHNPFKLFEKVRNCRIVVVGSYHAGVFALSQGIPVVGLAKSTYYIDKFQGLAYQFGAGCQVILLDNKKLQEKITVAIDRAWRSAERLKLPLLKAAREQIELSRAAYRQFYEQIVSQVK